MKILISGGCKNGKSFYAQRLCKALGGNLYYIATMIASDKEDEARIKNHQNEREGWGFTTIEQPRFIEQTSELLKPESSVLLDSLTALLANEMFVGSDFNENALVTVNSGLITLCEMAKNIVVVSDYIYSDAMDYGFWTEKYRKSLALAERKLASYFDAVIEVSYSSVIYHKGDKIEIY